MPVAALRELGVDLEAALERVNVPSYVIDRAGVVRWMNEAARKLVGDQVGRQFTSVVAPQETGRAREIFTRKVMGNSEVTDAAMVVVDLEGEHISVEISSVPLRRGDHVVGVFGQVSDVLEEPHAHPELKLTPRQAQVLRLLERGHSTAQFARARSVLPPGSRRSCTASSLVPAVARSHRGTAHHPLRRAGPLRSRPQERRSPGHRDDSRVLVGALPWPLLHVQGIQAVLAGPPTGHPCRSQGGDACRQSCVGRARRGARSRGLRVPLASASQAVGSHLAANLAPEGGAVQVGAAEVESDKDTAGKRERDLVRAARR